MRHPFYKSVVVMFCGPHDESEGIPTRRIDHAITIARSLEVPLFIAGDAFGGAEVQRFQARAWSMGVQTAIRAFDPRHCTLSDAQAVCRLLSEREFGRLTRVHLVTDWWHMERASVMLEGELESIVCRRILVVPESVMTGPVPNAVVHRNEQQGLEDYRAGVYGQRFVVDPLRHRPQPSL